MKLYLLLLTLFLQACAMGPKYQPAPQPEEEKALVYLMRGDVQYGGGYATKFKINDFEIVNLYDFGYSWTHLPAGQYTFSAGGEKLDLLLQSGETYYIEYHQEVKVIYEGYVSKRNVIQAPDKNSIQDQLSKSRFKESIEFAQAPLSKYRTFKNRDSSENISQVRFKFRKAENVPFIEQSANLYADNKHCNTGKESFPEAYIRGDYFNIESERLHTFELREKLKMNQYYLFCNERLSINFEKDHKYSISLKMDVNQNESRFGYCHYEVIDETKNIPHKYIVREVPFTFTGSKACDSKDLEANIKVSSSKSKIECRLQTSSGTKDC